MILESIHLRNAAGAVRIEALDGRDHLVLPCIALIGDQIIHAVNSRHPERVTTATLVKAAASFNLKPVVLGHPVKDGRQCSANSPEVAASHCIGIIKNSRVEGKKLLCEAWIDPVKAEKLGSIEFVNDLRANKPCDVSVGAFVTCDDTPGELNGKKFFATWLETLGDHLAVLWPKGRGACSWESGCGLRAAMHLVTAEGFDLDESPLIEACEVYLVAAKARYAECETCGGTGQVKDGEHQQDCPTCGGEGKMRAAMGARNSAADAQIIQSVHDQAMALGAVCDRANYKTLSVQLELDGKQLAAAITPELKAAERGQGASIMDKTKKAELIAALVTCACSGFKDGDQAFLETATDARLEEFKAAADGRKAANEAAAKNETDLRNATAKITVIEGKLRTAEAPRTKEQVLADVALVPELKTLLDNQAAQETETREALIKELKTAGANTEDELKAMPTAQLQTLAKYAKVQAPDFSGRGIPQPRAAAAGDLSAFAPPDPYAAELKTLRERAVN